MKRYGPLEWVSAALMVALVGVVFAQVVLRYATYQPLAWTEEVARYLFIWLCLCGAAIVSRRGHHFAMDFVLNLLPGTALRTVKAVLLLLEAALFGLIAWAGVAMLGIVAQQRSPTLDIAMSLPYLAIPAGCALMAGFALLRVAALWRPAAGR